MNQEPQQDQPLPQDQAAAAPESETVKIETVDDFAMAITQWHMNRLARLDHMKNVPLGTEIEVGDTKHIMEGDFLEGFKMGLHVSRHEFGTLPFMVEASEATPA